MRQMRRVRNSVRCCTTANARIKLSSTNVCSMHAAAFGFVTHSESTYFQADDLRSFVLRAWYQRSGTCVHETYTYVFKQIKHKMFTACSSAKSSQTSSHWTSCQQHQMSFHSIWFHAVLEPWCWKEEPRTHSVGAMHGKRRCIYNRLQMLQRS